MSATRYTEDHEWARPEGGTTVVIGITDYAQEQLGELVFIELPEVGSDLAQGDEVAVIESVKAAAEVKSPISGTVLETNDVLNDAPDTVNREPTGDGWFCRITASNPAELEGLMDEAAYTSYLATLE
jgi:glycine cleavage system H protein